MKKYALITLIIASVAACGDKEISVKKYYFPYADFMKPKVYEYVDGKDSNQVMYWYFKTDVKKGDTMLSTSFYNRNHVLTNVFYNKMGDKGSRLAQMYVNLGDSSNMYQCEVKKDEVFNWVIKPKQTLFVSYKMYSADTLQTEEIVTERSFEPKKERLNFNGKEYECIVTKEKTLMNHISPNRTKTEEQERTSYFAEGLGLLQMETFNAQGPNNLFKLKRILTEEEWKKLLNDTNKIQPLAK